MARVEHMRGKGREQQRNTQGRRVYTYVDGTAVRKLQSAPQEGPQRKKKSSTSLATRRNRARALQMNLGYVTFLTVAAVITVFMCGIFFSFRQTGRGFKKR